MLNNEDKGLIPSFNNLEKFLNNAFKSSLPLDIIEEDDKYRLVLEIPGLSKEDVKLHVVNDVLYLKIDKEEEENEEQQNYIYKGRSAINIQRAFSLENVKADEIKATLRKGLLEVVLPKKQEDNYQEIEID